MVRIWSSTAVAPRRFIIAIMAAGLASCGAQETDFSKNEGAVAWLAHHHGTIPNSCIAEMIEKYGTSANITDEARRTAQADAMQIAGQTYAISLASENLIAAREKELDLAKEGLARGYIVESGVMDAVMKLNEAIFDLKLSRMKLAGLASCNFTATDEAFGFKHRSEVSY